MRVFSTLLVIAIWTCVLILACLNVALPATAPATLAPATTASPAAASDAPPETIEPPTRGKCAVFGEDCDCGCLDGKPCTCVIARGPLVIAGAAIPAEAECKKGYHAACQAQEQLDKELARWHTIAGGDIVYDFLGPDYPWVLHYHQFEGGGWNSQRYAEQALRAEHAKRLWWAAWWVRYPPAHAATRARWAGMLADLIERW